MSDLAAALMVAIRVHAAQTDKQGEPYLLHVLRVVEAVSNEAKVVATLHDVGEDGTDKEWNDACEGLSHDEHLALSLVTRAPGHEYAAYIDKIARHHTQAAQIAREVKLADLRDNLGRIPPREDALEVEERPTLAGYVAVEVDGREGWDETWGSLKARYEKAIETLEAA